MRKAVRMRELLTDIYIIAGIRSANVFLLGKHSMA